MVLSGDFRALVSVCCEGVSESFPQNHVLILSSFLLVEERRPDLRVDDACEPESNACTRHRRNPLWQL